MSAPEFSRPVDRRHLPTAALHLVADEAERGVGGEGGQQGGEGGTAALEVADGVGGG